MGSQFEVLVIANIFSLNEKKGDIPQIYEANSFEEAKKLIYNDYMNTKSNPLSNAFHYAIWEYDEDEMVCNEWYYTWDLREIKDFQKWLREEAIIKEV